MISCWIQKRQYLKPQKHRNYEAVSEFFVQKLHACMQKCLLLSAVKKKYFSKFKRRQKQVKVWGCRLFLCLVMLGLDKGSSDRIAEHSSPVGTIWTIRTSRGGRYTRLWHDISEFWEIFCHITAIDHKIPLNTCLLRSSLRS